MPRTIEIAGLQGATGSAGAAYNFEILSLIPDFLFLCNLLDRQKAGAANPMVLERMALLELQIRPTLVSSISRESVRFDDQVGGRFRNNF